MIPVRQSLLLLIFILIALESPVFAGSWQTVYKATNMTTSSSGAGYSDGRELDSGEGSVDGQDTVTATLYWISYSSTDAPPSTITVQETASAEADAWSTYVLPDIISSNAADNGRGDACGASLDYADDDSDSQQTDKNTISWGQHLQQVSVVPTRGTIPGTSIPFWGVAALKPCTLTAHAEGDADATAAYAVANWQGFFSGCPVYGDNPPPVLIAVWLNYSVALAAPPKSILINRPENASASNVEKDKYVTDGGGEWQGSGDSRFDNVEYSDNEHLLNIGDALGWEDWTASLLSSPWPAADTIADALDAGLWTRNWHWYAEDGSTTPGTPSGSDSGDTYDIHAFTPHVRPHQDWPYSTSGAYVPHDLLDEMQSNSAPGAATRRINLHLTDTAIPGLGQPVWNFDHHANFSITYHNQYELIAAQPTYEVPTAENPWQIMVCNTGTIFQGSQSSTNVFVSGLDSNWSPSIYYSLDSSYNVSVNAVYLSGGGGQSSTSGYYLPVAPRTVPVGAVGVIYYRPYLIRCPFTYRQYVPAGRMIQGYDSQGNEIPFSNYVDRSAGGFGTHDIEAHVFLCKPGATFPPTLKTDADPILTQ